MEPETEVPAAGGPGLAEAAGGFAVGIVFSAIGASIGAAGTGYHAGAPGPTPLGVVVGGVVGLWIGLMGAVVVAARRCDARSVASFVGLRVAGAWDLLGGAAVGLVSQLALIPLLYLPVEQLDPSISHQLSGPARQDTGSAHGVVAVTVLLLILAVGAPLVEEMFFRGLVLRSLSARYHPLVAVAVTAALFALAHFEAVQFAGLAAFGLVLGALAHRTGRLGPSIAAHAAFNAAAVISLIH